MHIIHPTIPKLRRYAMKFRNTNKIYTFKQKEAPQALRKVLNRWWVFLHDTMGPTSPKILPKSPSKCFSSLSCFLGEILLWKPHFFWTEKKKSWEVLDRSKTAWRFPQVVKWRDFERFPQPDNLRDSSWGVAIGSQPHRVSGMPPWDPCVRRKAHPEIPQLWNMRGNSRIQLQGGGDRESFKLGTGGVVVFFFFSMFGKAKNGMGGPPPRIKALTKALLRDNGGS